MERILKKKRGEGTDRTSERDGGGWEKNATWTTELNDKAKDGFFSALSLCYVNFISTVTNFPSLFSSTPPAELGRKQKPMSR